MIKTLVSSVIVAAVAASALAAAAIAQNPPKLEFPAASPNAKLEQRFAITDVAITYARPSVKGRKIFGELVPYDAVWRTGANGATTVSFGTAVKFGGVDVPAGKYSLHTIPGANEWTVILNKVAEQWGSYKYDEKQDQARVKVKPAMLSETVETLEIGLTDVRDTSASLTIAWDKVRVSVKMEVDVKSVLVPQIEAAMAGEGKKPYFSSAMFYYEQGLDLKKALAWMEAGLAEQPDAFWMIYRKGLILEKSGDKQGALAAAEKSLGMAERAEGGIKDEYTRLNKALIARLK